MSGIIGRKAFVGGLSSLVLNARGSTPDRRWKLASLSVVEARGIPGVAVKCVDIGRNTSGESALLGHY